MRAVCPQCKKHVKFPLWKREAMKIQCPVCRNYIFMGFRWVERLLFLLAIGLLLFIFFTDILSNLQLIILIAGFILFEYVVKFIYISIHNLKYDD